MNSHTKMILLGEFDKYMEFWIRSILSLCLVYFFKGFQRYYVYQLFFEVKTCNKDIQIWVSTCFSKVIVRKSSRITIKITKPMLTLISSFKSQLFCSQISLYSMVKTTISQNMLYKVPQYASKNLWVKLAQLRESKYDWQRTISKTFLFPCFLVHKGFNSNAEAKFSITMFQNIYMNDQEMTIKL